MAEGVVISALDGNLLYWNPAAVEMHGFANSEDLQWHLSKFIDLLNFRHLMIEW